jgi:hypothetical protein
LAGTAWFALIILLSLSLSVLVAIGVGRRKNIKVHKNH